MRKWRLILSMLTTVLILTIISACLPIQNEPMTPANDTREVSSIVAPSIEVQERYYGGVSPYLTGETRGRLYSNLSRYRLDADRLELGLMEMAQAEFPIEDYLFQEGQVITSTDLSSWLGFASDTNSLGLNPEGASSRVLEHVLEHNYLHARDQELGGIVIGLSMAPLYEKERENDEGNIETIQSWYLDDELMNYGQEMADEITQRLRARVGDVPLVFAIYRLEERNSLRPGSFLSIGVSSQGSQDVSSWQSINEVYYTFPSSQLREIYPNHSREFAHMLEDFKDYFPQNVSMVGTGRFIDEQLVELKLEVTTEFASKAEVVQLTQYIGNRIMNVYPNGIHLSVYIQSINEPKSIFVRSSDGDPYMHIYR